MSVLQSLYQQSHRSLLSSSSLFPSLSTALGDVLLTSAALLTLLLTAGADPLELLPQVLVKANWKDTDREGEGEGEGAEVEPSFREALFLELAQRTNAAQYPVEVRHMLL
jgi:hypothetical protein